MNKPFFQQQLFTNTELPVKKREGCKHCRLYLTCKTPKMQPHGLGKRGILFIAEAPGGDEDKLGYQLVGQAGKLLRNRCKQFDIDIDRDAVKVNAVNCRPIDAKGNNRKPTTKEIDYCRPMVWKAIKEMKPKLIILLGGVAVESFLGHRWKHGPLGGINRWRGWTIPDRDAGAWVCPTFHPSFVSRSVNVEGVRGHDEYTKRQPVVDVIFRQDLERAFDLLDIAFPYLPIYDLAHEKQKVWLFTKKQDVIYELKKILDSELELIAFDFETTGLKPHREGHEIVCASIATRGESAVSFMMQDEKVKEQFAKILMSNRIGKIAHNLQFEDAWSRHFGMPVRNWKWDSMIAAHVLDNRPGITGLKFQVYVNFGVVDYDSHLAPYLRGNKDANSFNRIREAPQDELLTYCGLDALFEYRLAEKQMEVMG